MAIDLFKVMRADKNDPSLQPGYVIELMLRGLCGEARVCMGPDPLEGESGCRIGYDIEGAKYDVVNGLVVQDGHTKKCYRLKVTAIEVPTR